MDFVGFPKIGRLFRDIVITEKIDGTNGCIRVPEPPDVRILVGSRTRWITPEKDNHGFAKWAYENWLELTKLGPGLHFGEWWGQGIQRNYGLKEKRFSLFNTAKWSDPAVRPACCGVVPVIYAGPMSVCAVNQCINDLRMKGSVAVPGYMNPEGIVVFHTAANVCFKATLEGDEKPKGLVE
jgi:hypothetical protein